MTGKVFSIDQAIREQTPQVELRGELYKVRDMSVRDRMKAMLDLADTQADREAEAAEKVIAADQLWEHLQDIYAQAVQQVLEGVPDEVSGSITEAEFTLLQQAIALARGVELQVGEKKTPASMPTG